MTSFKNPISANQQLLTGSLSVVADSQRALLQLLTETNPLLKPQLEQLRGQFEQGLHQIEAASHRAVLEGRGIKGNLRTLAALSYDKISSAESVLPAVSANPADAKGVLKAFYRHIGMYTEQGTIAWAAPFKENFPRGVTKGVTLEEADKFEPVDRSSGIYPVQKGDDLRGFIVVVRVDDNSFVVMSSQSPPQLFTFVEIEGEWLAHSQWDYLDMGAFQVALAKLTAGNLGSFTFDEKKWAALFKALPPKAYESVGAIQRSEGGVEIKIDDHLTLHFDGEKAFMMVDKAPNGEVPPEEERYIPFVAVEQFDYSFPFLNNQFKSLEERFNDHITGKPAAKPAKATKTASKMANMAPSQKLRR